MTVKIEIELRDEDLGVEVLAAKMRMDCSALVVKIAWDPGIECGEHGDPHPTEVWVFLSDIEAGDHYDNHWIE